MPSPPPLRPRRALPWRPAALLALSGVLLSGCVVAPRHPVYARQPMPPAPPAQAAPMYFYPTLGQSEDKQDRDRYECYRWAVRETGTDPGMTTLREGGAVSAPVRSAPPPSDGAAVAGGAIAGAAVGSVMASPRRAGEGAVLGAVFGAMMGAASDAQRQRNYEATVAQQDSARAARTQAPQANFRRAMSACMEGRGYTVR